MKVKCLSGEALILKNTVEMCEISFGRLRQTDTTVFNTRNNPGLCVEDMSVFHLALFQGGVNIHVSFDVYMGVAAAIDIKNTDAFDFLIDLLTPHEKTKLLDFAVLVQNVDIIEVLMPKCDYQKVFDSVSRRHRTHMRVCNAAWRKMEELLPKIEWMKAVELKKTLTHALNGEPVSHAVARKM